MVNVEMMEISHLHLSIIEICGANLKFCLPLKPDKRLSTYDRTTAAVAPL